MIFNQQITGGGGDDSDYIAFLERSTNTPNLPDGLTKIGDYAFNEWSNLALTSLPSGLTSIGANAFQYCTNLALTSLPSGITSIGNRAFYYCTSIALTSLPSGLTRIGSGVFQHCYNIELTSLPSGITSIGNGAFQYCTGLVNITCDAALGTSGIEMSAFQNCDNLTSALFPNDAQSSLSTVFGSPSSYSACKKLEIVDIGKTSAIAASAFANCYKLQTLILRKTASICTLANVSAFLNTPMRGYNSLTGTVYVPSALISTYQTATNWSTLYNDGTLTFAAIEGSEYE